MKEDLRKLLFVKAALALEAYQAAVATKPWSDETRRRHDRFCALWDAIEAEHLEEEYEAWKEG